MVIGISPPPIMVNNITCVPKKKKKKKLRTTYHVLSNEFVGSGCRKWKDGYKLYLSINKTNKTIKEK